jgi:hypothetical protein
VKTLASHFNAIEGAVKVPAFEKLDDAAKSPKNSLALAAAAVHLCLFKSLMFLICCLTIQVERALRLWATGTLTIQMVNDEDNLPKDFNVVEDAEDDEDTHIETAFNESEWGDVTRDYLESIAQLREGSLNEIMKLAFAEHHAARPRKRAHSAIEEGEAVGERKRKRNKRACIVDLTEHDDCNVIYRCTFLMYVLTFFF